MSFTNTKAIQKHNSYIHMYNTNNASIVVLQSRNILLDSMHKFHCKSKTLIFLIICNEIPEIYLHKILSYARSNDIRQLQLNCYNWRLAA